MLKKSLKKRKILCLALGIVSILSFTACGNNNQSNRSSNKEQKNLIENNKNNSKEDKKDNEKENNKVETKFTNGFSIENLEDGIKKVVDGENRTLILVPKTSEIPEEYKNEKIIRTPVENVLLGSTTFACSMRSLEEIKSIGAVTNEEKYWQIEEIKKSVQEGTIKFVGTDKSPDYEMITEVNPDLCIVYTGQAGQQDFIAKLDELGLNYVVSNAYLEENPFARMEWSKLIGAFFHKEELASKHLDKAVEKVEVAKKSIEGKDKPKIVWATISKGTVYAPRTDSYVAEMIEMAGGEYLFDVPGTGNEKISLEVFYEMAQKADLFMYASTTAYSPDLQSVLEKGPILEKLPVVKNRNVWAFHPDYYQSVDKTDELIIDLMEIFNPGSTGEEIRHYIKY